MSNTVDRIMLGAWPHLEHFVIGQNFPLILHKFAHLFILTIVKYTKAESINGSSRYTGNDIIFFIEYVYDLLHHTDLVSSF